MNTTTFSLTAQERETTKKSARDSRAEGMVPGVLYGHKVDAKSIQLPYSDLLRIYRVAGESALIDLTLGSKKTKVLIHRMELHPVTRRMNHIDFYAVNLKEKTDIQVPLEFVGESEAIKSKGGILMKDNESITIRCLPSDIPSHIDVDLSVLKEFNDQILVSDLAIDSSKHEIMGIEMDSMVAMVIAPKLVVEEVEETLSEIVETETTDEEDKD